MADSTMVQARETVATHGIRPHIGRNAKFIVIAGTLNHKPR